MCFTYKISLYFKCYRIKIHRFGDFLIVFEMTAVPCMTAVYFFVSIETLVKGVRGVNGANRVSKEKEEGKKKTSKKANKRHV